MTFAASPLTGYDEELARAESDISKLESSPRDLGQRARLAYRLFHRASLTGSMQHFRAAGDGARDAIREFGWKEDLCLLQVNLDFRFHRLAEVKRDLEACPALSHRIEGRALVADLEFQEGRYDEARLEYERLIAESGAWDNIARLAHWHSKLGDPDEADRLYKEAEDDLTAKQMRSYAWLELQRGVLALSRGRLENARAHYERADASYSGYWQVNEHFAELLAAEEKFDEAEAAFGHAIESSRKPELQQALGELYVLWGKTEKAEPWFDRALDRYLESAHRGEVQYLHHLADFYIEARPNPPEAVRWARKDLEMRPNFSTQAALACALHLNGEIQEALVYMRLALGSGVRDSHIFSNAARLFEAAGNTVEAKRWADAADQNNPKHHSFHMHH